MLLLLFYAAFVNCQIKYKYMLLTDIKIKISTLNCSSSQKILQFSFEVCVIMNSILTRGPIQCWISPKWCFLTEFLKGIYFKPHTSDSIHELLFIHLLCVLCQRFWAFAGLRLETFPFILADYSDSILNYVSLRSGTEFFMWSLFSNWKAEHMFCF